jgi:hypothetical protein
MRVYRGYRQPGSGAVSVTVEDADGVQRPLDPRLDLLYMPGVLDWGPGRNCAQLAVALVADALHIASEDGLDVLALHIYQSFKVWVVMRLPAEGWRLDGDDVLQVLAQIADARERD